MEALEINRLLSDLIFVFIVMDQWLGKLLRMVFILLNSFEDSYTSLANRDMLFNTCVGVHLLLLHFLYFMKGM